MGRGSGQEALLEDRFAGIMGNRRGSARGQKLRDEAEQIEAHRRLAGMLGPRSDQATEEGRIQFLYDFLALHKLGVTPGSEFYPQLVGNVVKSIIGRGAGTARTHIVRRPRLQEILVWLNQNKSDETARPVVDALTLMVYDNSISPLDLAKIPDILCADGKHTASFSPLFQALTRDKACDARMWEVVDGLVPHMVFSLQQAGVESLGDELQHFVELLGKRRREHVSSPIEYK